MIARSARKALVQMNSAKRAGDAVRRALGALKAFALTIGDVTLRFDVDALEGVADSGDLAEDMRDLLVEVGLAARENGTGFALILDEMQNLPRRDLEALVVGLHRAKQKGLPVALVGAGLPLLPELTGEAKSYAERGFEFRGIGALDRPAAAAALVEPAKRQNVTWQRGAVDRVVELTEGYPYFRERRYLSAIAWRGDGPQRSGEIARALGKDPNEVSVVRDRLLKAGLIYAPRRGEVDFTVPLCADYLRRTSTDLSFGSMKP